jgi:hypothetical protein
MTESTSLRRWALLVALPACVASTPSRATAVAQASMSPSAPAAPTRFQPVVAASFYRRQPDQSWRVRGSRGGGDCVAPCWLWVPIGDAHFSVEATSLDLPVKSVMIQGESLAFRGGPVAVGLERKRSIGLKAGLIGGGLGAGILAGVFYATSHDCDGYGGIACIFSGVLGGVGAVLVVTGFAVGERTSLEYRIAPASGVAAPPLAGAAETSSQNAR